jgi:hypothetical protein
MVDTIRIRIDKSEFATRGFEYGPSVRAVCALYCATPQQVSAISVRKS